MRQALVLAGGLAASNNWQSVLLSRDGVAFWQTVRPSALPSANGAVVACADPPPAGGANAAATPGIGRERRVAEIE